MHILVVVHNGVATTFTQFTDDDGLFNTGPSSLEGAEENDGILLVLAIAGFAVCYIWIVAQILLKID